MQSLVEDETVQIHCSTSVYEDYGLISDQFHSLRVFQDDYDEPSNVLIQALSVRTKLGGKVGFKDILFEANRYRNWGKNHAQSKSG